MGRPKCFKVIRPFLRFDTLRERSQKKSTEKNEVPLCCFVRIELGKPILSTISHHLTLTIYFCYFSQISHLGNDVYATPCLPLSGSASGSASGGVANTIGGALSGAAGAVSNATSNAVSKAKALVTGAVSDAQAIAVIAKCSAAASAATSAAASCSGKYLLSFL